MIADSARPSGAEIRQPGSAAGRRSTRSSPPANSQVRFGTHPSLALASSGVRLMTQLARQFEERPEVRYGMTTMCIGIGMGGTVIWENPAREGKK